MHQKINSNLSAMQQECPNISEVCKRISAFV